jgi:hypothetical protein
MTLLPYVPSPLRYQAKEKCSLLPRSTNLVGAQNRIRLIDAKAAREESIAIIKSSAETRVL